MNTSYDSPKLDIILDALSSQKRRGIVHDLSFRPCTVGMLAKNHGLSLPAIHKHVRLLEQSELIVRKKSGRTNFLALNASSLALVQSWVNQYHVAWSNPQATLENYISNLQE